MIGNSRKNKRSCFCEYWFDPTRDALKPLQTRDNFEVDIKKTSKCAKSNLQTKAVGTCKYFTAKI